MTVEVAGPIHAMLVMVETGNSPAIPCEVMGFSGADALLTPFAALEAPSRSDGHRKSALADPG